MKMDYKEIYEHKIDTEDEGLLVKYSMNGKEYFDAEAAIAALLIEKKIFMNSNWWEKEWPEEAQKRISMNVNCNDVFAWGCADAESLDYSEIKDLFDHYQKDSSWGTAVWCIKKRGYLPQKPIFNAIQSSGIWDLTKMELKDGFNWKLSNKEKK